MRVVTGDGRNSASSAADPPIETAPLSRRSVTLNLVPPTPYLNVVECLLGRRLAEFIPVKRPPPLWTQAAPTLKLGVGGPAPHDNLNIDSCSGRWQNFFRHLSEGDGFNASRRVYVPQFGLSAALLVVWRGVVRWGGVGRGGVGWGAVWCDVGVVWGCNSARRDVT